MPAGAASGPISSGRGCSTRSSACLLRESQVQPLLLVFEDLHWADADTQALLEGLVESLPSHRLLLLVNYRSRVPARLGEQDLLRADPPRPAGVGDGRDASRGPPGPRCGAGAAAVPPDRAGPGQPLLPRGERAQRWRRPGCSPASAARTASPRPSRSSRCRRRSRRSWPRGSTACRRRTRACCSRRRSSARTCRSPCSRRSPTSPRTTWRAGWGGCSRRSSSTRRGSSPTSSTRSSTRSPTRSPTRACSTSGGGPCTRGSSPRSRASIRPAWPSTASGSSTTPSGARSGRRRSRT